MDLIGRDLEKITLTNGKCVFATQTPPKYLIGWKVQVKSDQSVSLKLPQTLVSSCIASGKDEGWRPLIISLITGFFRSAAQWTVYINYFFLFTGQILCLKKQRFIFLQSLFLLTCKHNDILNLYLLTKGEEPSYDHFALNLCHHEY